MADIIKKVSLLIISVLCLACILFGCNDKKGNIVSIKATDGILKSTYDVDEVVDLDSLKVTVVYADGSEEEVSDDIVITGFDTSTTGSKTMTVTYKGEYSFDFPYSVVYSVMPSQQISTSARIVVDQRPYPTAVSRLVGVKIGSLEGIEAVTFTVESADKIKGKYECEMLRGGWDYRITDFGERSFKIVVFRNGGNTITSDADIFALNFFSVSNSFSIGINNVTVTDGTKDYALPNVSAV